MFGKIGIKSSKHWKNKGRSGLDRPVESGGEGGVRVFKQSHPIANRLLSIVYALHFYFYLFLDLLVFVANARVFCSKINPRVPLVSREAL